MIFKKHFEPLKIFVEDFWLEMNLFIHRVVTAMSIKSSFHVHI